MPEELSPSQAAARIGATTRSVQRWIAAGKLPARRVGGRWRVASDALDAFMVPAERGEPAADPGGDPGPVRGESRRDRGTDPADAPTGWASGRWSRATDGLPPVDLLDVAAVVAAARAAGADALHPGLRLPGREAPTSPRPSRRPGSAGSGRRPAAIRAMGDKAAARRLAADARRPESLPGYDDADQTDDALDAAAKRIGYPLHRQAVGRRRRQGDADRARPRGAADCARGRPARGAGRLRRRPADPRALRRGPASRRDPGPLRCRTATASTSASATARSSGATRRSSRRRRRRPSTRRCAPRLGDAALAARRAPSATERRDVRVPRRRPRRRLLPRDEHAAPGRASGHRGS